MRRLMLLRHAKSDWSALGARDHDRTLAGRGREAAPKIGAYMAGHGLMPDLVICSTAIRARDTWELASAAFAPKPAARYDERLYDAEPERILAVVKETASGVHSLLLVGHNPGLKDVAELMVATGDPDARRQLADKLPTAGLVVIEFTDDGWDRLRAHSGRLDRIVTPRSLASSLD